MGKVTLRSRNDLGLYLARLRRRLRLLDGWQLTQLSLPFAAAGAVLMQLLGRAWPVENLPVWTLAPLATWLLAVLAVTLVRPYPTTQVARRVDLHLGLKERLSTAVALGTWKETFAHEGEHTRGAATAFRADLVDHQHQDALFTVRALDPRRAFPLPWLRRPTMLAGILLAGTLALAVLPNPMDAVLAERAEVAQAAEEQAEHIEDFKEEIEAAEGLTPEERERLLRELGELAEQLRANPGDRAEALADISRMEADLRPRLNPNASLEQAALESLAAQLKALAGQEAGEKSDLSAAAQALEALSRELGDMGAEQRESLAQQLAQMAARAAQAGQADLAQALASMAQAAQSGDSQAASQAAQQAAGALSQAQASLSDQAALQAALSQLQASRQALAEAGQGTPMASSQGQGQGQGNQAGSGGGSQANTLPPATRTGRAGDPQGPGRSSGLSDYESQVFVPWERRQGQGEELNIPGQDTGQGETQVREGQNPLPGAAGPARVPYQEVFYDYLDTASQAIESSYIPSGLKDYVREYFSQLEP